MEIGTDARLARLPAWAQKTIQQQKRTIERLQDALKVAEGGDYQPQYEKDAPRVYLVNTDPADPADPAQQRRQAIGGRYSQLEIETDAGTIVVRATTIGSKRSLEVASNESRRIAAMPIAGNVMEIGLVDWE